MTLTKTRQAIVEDKIAMIYMIYGIPEDDKYKKDLREAFTQALNDHTESIIEMVEGKKKNYETRHDLGLDKETINIYNQALNDIKEELVK